MSDRTRGLLVGIEDEQGCRVLQAELDEAGPEEGRGLLKAEPSHADSRRGGPIQEAWTNRLIAGDSLLVMNSLVEKEGMAGKVQMVYLDPPYGIDYASNFQPFTRNRTVKDRDDDLTQEPETITAFRDTWSRGIHSYLDYIRDRVVVARDLLSPSGSLFVQIGEDNQHLVRQVLDEVFGPGSCYAQIIFRKKMMPLSKKPGCEAMNDYILWYVKSRPEAERKIRQLFVRQDIEGNPSWGDVELPTGGRRALTPDETARHALLPDGSRVYQPISMKPREYRENQDFNFEFEDRVFPPPGGAVARTPDGVHCWSTTREGMTRLRLAHRLQVEGSTLRYVLFHEDYPVVRLTGMWNDTAPPQDMKYVVETTPLVVQRCLLMATEPGDLVLDPTCGSGTTAVVAERWGRRWITCDTSRVSIALARQRLMTTLFDYYDLSHPEEGVASGFRYKTVPHLKLGSIANNPDIREGMKRVDIDDAIRRHAEQETLYDQPFTDRSKARVTGPFTVEAVPAPAVRVVGDIREDAVMDRGPEVSVARAGPTLRQSEWTGELLKCGIRAKGGQHIHFSRVEPLPGARWLHADAETKEAKPKRVVVSFGPEHAPLEQRQVGLALEEAQALLPKPGIVAFAAFHFDPEAAKDIDETKWPGVTLLKVQMNTDLLTEDLKKKRASNESFWMIGQPDVEVRKAKDDKARWQVEVKGFDYYDPRTGTIVSGDTTKIAIWMLDTDYDGRSLYPRQVFFPMAGEKDGWARLARNLKAEIDEERIEQYRGSVSLPFEAGGNRRVAVKIVDDRGIESLRVVELR